MLQNVYTPSAVTVFGYATIWVQGKQIVTTTWLICFASTGVTALPSVSMCE